MRRTVPMLVALTLGGCASPAAPEKPPTPVVRYVSACAGVFALYRDGAQLGLFYFADGAAYPDTVSAGPHTVGYSRLDGFSGATLNTDERLLDVRGEVTYPMACLTVSR